MTDTQSKDKLSAALSYIFFLIPIMMDQKTEFTSFHMKQSFLLFIAYIIAWITPVIGGILSVIVFFHAIFLMWKAYSGEKYSIEYIYPYSEKLISILGIQSIFSVEK